MSGPKLLWHVRAELGEGPFWSTADRCVWFVDIKGRRLHRYGIDGCDKRSWAVPDQIGFAVPADDGSLICGMRDGLYRFEVIAGTFSLLQPIEPDLPGNRINDGFVASDGSLWFGTMDDGETGLSGSLYRWSRGSLERMDSGYGITNGPALSPDGKTLYHNDTLQRTVYAYDHCDGALSNRRIFARMPRGFPDGLAVDQSGTVHVCLFAGAAIVRLSPSGDALAPIEFPVPNITKACFGGDDLRTLFCTTAWKGQSQLQRRGNPVMGGLFAVQVDVPGLPQSVAVL